MCVLFGRADGEDPGSGNTSYSKECLTSLDAVHIHVEFDLSVCVTVKPN